MSLDDEAPLSPDAPTLVEEPPSPSSLPPTGPFPPAWIPNIDHLVFDDGEPVESLLFERLMHLLYEILLYCWKGPGPGRTWMACTNVGIFHEPQQTGVAPDFLLSFDVPQGRDLLEKKNNSYLIWEMGKPPTLVIEFVSDRRGGEASLKKRHYARIGVAYYVTFDPREFLDGSPLQGFELRGGVYEPIATRWLPNVGLGLVLWEGTYSGDQGRWLRWCDEAGQLLPLPDERIKQAELAAQHEKERADQERERADQEKERADQERERADQERERADQERERAERLAAKLRALGIDPSTLEGT